MSKKRKRTVRKKVLSVLLTLCLIAMTTAAMSGIVFAVYVQKYIVAITDIDLDSYGLDFTSFVYYTDSETGEAKLLEELYAGENRVWVNLEQIPEYLQKAFICIEDTRFERHHGVDWKRTIGATLSWTGLVKFTGGGSTITQQLIKNVTKDNDTTVKRKVQEIFRALALERKYTKNEILEMYLNTIFLGQSYNGVKTAAQGYFGKDVSELTLAECASIAAITKYPYKYDPFRNAEANKERQEVILNEMCKQGVITEIERDEAKAQQLVFAEKDSSSANSASSGGVQSYFVDQVITDVINDLMSEKGYSKKVATDMLYTGGLRVYATINPEIQSMMDKVFTNESNFPNIKGKDGSLPQAAMVIMDPYTGNVVAMVGGRGEKTAARVLNRATSSLRSPGSAIKPLSVYAPAIEYGYIKLSSVFDDVPIDFTVNSRGWPKNYYTRSSNPNGSRYYGRMSVIKAVEISNNTIPAYLLNLITPSRAYAFLSTNLGVSTLVKSQTTSKGKVVSDISGLASLSLGGLTNGISVLELTAAYSSFVNDGIYISPRTYTKVVDASGTVILEKTQTTNVAMEKSTAASMVSLLENVVTGSSGTGRNAKIKGIETAGKTGTTTDDVDRWFVGMTPYYVASVWFGYDKQQTVNVSSNPALSLWKKVMDLVHEDLPNRSFEKPSNFVSVSFCEDSGCIATEWCKADPRGSRVKTFTMDKADKPTEYCTLHTPVTVCTDSNCIADEYCPNTKKVGLLKITRSFPIAGIYVDDQQYTVAFDSKGNVISAEEAVRSKDSGNYPALAVTTNGIAYNSVCTLHSKPQEANVPEENEVDIGYGENDTQTQATEPENGTTLPATQPVSPYSGNTNPDDDENTSPVIG